MPFGHPFDRYFENIFVPAVVDAGLEPVRADSLFTSTQIIGDIWQLTRQAKLLLADLSGKNPNVFYELGLAHAIGKPVVLLASSIDAIPFDLRSLRVIIYDKENESWGRQLRADIARAVRDTIENVAAAVPLPFVEPKEIERPKEDATTYEIRKLWDEIRAIRSQQTMGTSQAPSLLTAEVAQYLPILKLQLPEGDLLRTNDTILARAIALVLAGKYIDAIRAIREAPNWDLIAAKHLADRIRALVERGAT